MKKRGTSLELNPAGTHIRKMYLSSETILTLWDTWGKAYTFWNILKKSYHSWAQLENAFWNTLTEVEGTFLFTFSNLKSLSEAVDSNDFPESYQSISLPKNNNNKQNKYIHIYIIYIYMYKLDSYISFWFFLHNYICRNKNRTKKNY